MQPRNPYICLAIVVTLGVSMLIGLVGIILLASTGKEAPSSLVAIASGALGSLSSFLVSVPARAVGGGNDSQAQPAARAAAIAGNPPNVP